jgi:hypothetical protein
MLVLLHAGAQVDAHYVRLHTRHYWSVQGNAFARRIRAVYPLGRRQLANFSREIYFGLVMWMSIN